MTNASKGTSDRHKFHCRKVRQMDNNNYYDHNDDNVQKVQQVDGQELLE